MLWGLEFSQTSKYSYISNELFYFVLHTQFIPTATEQCVIFKPSPTQCFEQCLRSIGTVELFLQRCISLCPAISQEPRSSRKASSTFRILNFNNYFVPVSSWMHVSVLWGSHSVWSSFSFLSPRSTPPSHFPLTNSCRATLMSHASAFIQNRPCG